jgi:carboxyl-terminal processing protease
MYSNRFPAAFLTAKFWALSSLCVILVSCGGGGSGGGGDSDIPSSASVANQCTAPRPGTSDGAGSIDTEKSWVRSFMNETYLWYQDIPKIDSTNYTVAAYGNSVPRALDAYFRALKTTKTTASGKLVDEFSFTVNTADLIKQQSGVASGFGIRRTPVLNPTPRSVRVLYLEEGSPAQIAGVQRGDTIVSVNNVDINDPSTAGLTAILAGLNPIAAGKTTVLGLQAPGAALRMVSVTSSESITVTPVPLTKTLTMGTNTVGYITLNSFNVNRAEKQLFDSITQLKAANISELVLDLRYNGGGYLQISNELAWMIGGSSLAGNTFEKIRCNDKNPLSICNANDIFRQTSSGIFSLSKGQALPQLGLKRVFVLTSQSTCSASESVINGLSPFIEVVLIGSKTCGKPYGFNITPNCGTSYAAIQFQGVNAKGFGDYADGFAPTCQVADDLTKPRGDTSELMLAGALKYISTGSCPAVSMASMKQQAGAIVDEGNYQVWRDPIEEQRILGRPAGTP